MNGTGRIAGAFQLARRRQRAALIPYVMAGLPDDDSFVATVCAMADAGADIVEVGLPFSDPLADGPVIQEAGRRALQRGVTVRHVLELVARITSRVDTPIVVMGYANPILAFGIDRFCSELAAAGGAGVIVADMPPEEAADLVRAADVAGIAVIFLVAPTSGDERIRTVATAGSGFVYCVSLTGTTGARRDLDAGLGELLARVRENSDIPVAVGFGISTAEQVAELAPLVDGVVVGSALVGRILDAPAERVTAVAADFVAGLASSCGPVASQTM